MPEYYEIKGVMQKREQNKFGEQYGKKNRDIKTEGREKEKLNEELGMQLNNNDYRKRGKQRIQRKRKDKENEEEKEMKEEKRRKKTEIHGNVYRMD